MPRGTILTEAEQQLLLGACIADDGSQRSLRHIQKLLKEQAGTTRSINVIHNFLASPERYGMGKGKAAAGRKLRVITDETDSSTGSEESTLKSSKRR
jgi:hypothetical protein